MNGTLTHVWRGCATRSVTIVELRNGGSLDVEKGDLFDVAEDHYGNTYVYDAAGAEFSLFHLEPVEAPPQEWHADGLRERVAYLSSILDRRERPVEGEHRAELEAKRDHAAAVLQRLSTVTAAARAEKPGAERA